MPPKFNYFRLLEPHLRKFSTAATSKPQNFYDCLGLTAKATQADIKSAYYKLSMMYHPDKNKDSSEAANKFRSISEAYEVLGNVKSRRLYDRGLYIDGVKTPFTDDTVNKFYKSRDVRSRPPAPTGRTVVYDYDEWSRSHYGDTFAKAQRIKEQRRQKEFTKQKNIDDIKSEKVIFLIGLTLVLITLYYSNPNYDEVKTTVMGSSLVITRDNSK